jgi:cyclopropane fatty-acyl-phospholipid synthase-like methyltransferase
MSDQIYDDLDPMYRAIWGKSLHHGYWKAGKENATEAKENLIQEILKHWQPSGQLADIGCGYGALSRRLVEDFDCSVIACTSSKLQAAEITKSQEITVLSGDWLAQDISPSSLDGAIALESASHFEDFEHLLKKTHEALKPGASWIICDWFSENGQNRLLRHLASTGGLPPWRSLASFLSLARQCGFTVTLSLDLSDKVARTWNSLLLKALQLPLVRPRQIPRICSELLKRPALIWTFPLLRISYQLGFLSYSLIKLTKGESLSSRPKP